MPHALYAVSTAIPLLRWLLPLAPSIEELAHGVLKWVKAATASALTAFAMLLISSRGPRIAVWSGAVYCAVVVPNPPLVGGTKPTLRSDATADSLFDANLDPLYAFAAPTCASKA